MSPEIQAVIRELETQRRELLSGIAIVAAYEKAATRSLEAIMAAEQTKAEIASLKAELAKKDDKKPTKR